MLAVTFYQLCYCWFGIWELVAMWYPKPSVAKLVKVAISVVSRHITSVCEPPFNIKAHDTFSMHLVRCMSELQQKALRTHF